MTREYDPNEYRIDVNEPLPMWKRQLGAFTRLQQGLGGPDSDPNASSIKSGEGDESNSESPARGGSECSEGETNNGPTSTSDEDELPEDEFGPEDGPDGFSSPSAHSEPHDTESELETSQVPEMVERGPTLDEINNRRTVINVDTNADGDVIRNFNSWHKFVQCVCDDSLYGWQSSGVRSSHDGNDYFRATRSWNEAIRMATITGWPEGRKLLSDALTLVRPRMDTYKSIEFSVAGAFPMVPNYCAGDPECMVVDPGADTRNSKPIIRIDFNHYVVNYISTETMMYFGAAVVSLAETLEARGFSTELRIIGNAQGIDLKHNRVNWRYNIVYKQAGEPLDLDRAAFAIAHPSSMRRLAFALLEQSADLIKFGRGYGHPLMQANETPEFGTIFIPSARQNCSLEQAREAVAKAAEETLNAI